MAAVMQLGLGARFTAQFNRHRGLPCDHPFAVDVEVVGLHHGTIVGRLGYAQGRTLVLENRDIRRLALNARPLD